MKILELSPYISLPAFCQFSKNISGFGYMVWDIACSLAKQKCEVDLLTNSAFTDTFSYHDVSMVKRSWGLLFKYSKFSFILLALKIIWKRKTLINSLRILYYYFAAGYVYYIIKKGKYDIVHIHGIVYSSLAFIDCCRKMNIGFVVTLHGLIDSPHVLNADVADKKLENDFLKWVKDKPDIQVTFVSTGILDTVIQKMGWDKIPENFHAIPNGTALDITSDDMLDVKVKYDIPENAYLALCIGNLSVHKNQAQIARAYSLLPDSYKEKLFVLFLGNDISGGEVSKYISAFSFQEHLVICGNIDKAKIASYYNAADCVVLASLSEGFGLSLIEGFYFGLPALTFADLPAVSDLYHSKSMILLTDREDEVLRDGLITMINADWDRDFIKNYADNFSLDKMAEKYMSLFYQCIVK